MATYSEYFSDILSLDDIYVMLYDKHTSDILSLDDIYTILCECSLIDIYFLNERYGLLYKFLLGNIFSLFDRPPSGIKVYLLDDIVSFFDEFELNFKFKKKEILTFSDNIKLKALTKLFSSIRFFEKSKILSYQNSSDFISFSDIVRGLSPEEVYSFLQLYDRKKFKLSKRITDIFLLDTDISSSYLSFFKDKLLFFDLLQSRAFFSFISSDFLYYNDISSLLGKQLQKVFFLLSFSSSSDNPILYSFGSTSIQITGFDEIITAEDGIYIFDEERTAGDLVFNFGTLEKAKLKRLDKIFADTDLTEATVITEKGIYTYFGNKWINVAKGLMAKEIKVLLEDLERIEFVNFRFEVLRRPK